MTAQTYPEPFQQHSIAKSARSNVGVRMIFTQDRALIYNTIARLQAAGLAYRGCRTNCFLVVDASNDTEDIKHVQSAHVYLTSLADIVSGLPREELAARAEEWHWDALHCLFSELDYSDTESADSRLRSMIPHATRTITLNKANVMEGRLLSPLLHLQEHIRIPTMPTMPQNLGLASALHPSYFIDMNSMPPLWSLTKPQIYLEGHDHEEDRYTIHSTQALRRHY